MAQMSRYFVPDLSPADRPELRLMRARVIFVAESPHTSEIAPEKRADRRPLCGAAGRKWWKELGEAVGEAASDDVSLERMLRLCLGNGVVLLNAVQQPLDCAVAKQVADAHPHKTVGFSKNPGPHSYKKLKGERVVQEAIRLLKLRLESPELRDAPIYCLGNDAEWFVKHALGKEEFARRVRGRIPHPAAWWRKGGHFGRAACAALREIFAPGLPRIKVK